MIITVQQGLRRDGQKKNGIIYPKVGIQSLGGNFGLKCSNLFGGLPLEAEGSSFSPRLSIANTIVGSAWQIYHAEPMPS